jgi:hypothetical protein
MRWAWTAKRSAWFCCAAAFMISGSCEFSADNSQSRGLDAPAAAGRRGPAIIGGVVSMGEVSVDDGPRELEHVFEVVNRSSRSVEIVDVKSSCGCLKSELGSRNLEPAQSTLLRIVIRVAESGRVQQTVNLILDDGTTATFMVTVVGTRQIQLTTVPQRMRVDVVPGRVRVRLLVVDRSGVGEDEPPRVRMHGQHHASEFDGWLTLEEPDSTLGRPKRQLGSLYITLDEPQVVFPVPIEITTHKSLKAVVYLDHFE